MRPEEAAAVFAELRPYLHGVAYRLTSSWADAEDVVADAWPRWSEWAEQVDDPRGWLTRVVARLAVDHLKSARVRRESYTGPWLPEPVVTTVGGPQAEPDPLEQLVTDESVRLAFLVVLDELSPEQRVAVVLHDVLRVDFAGVAEVLGCSPAAARQYASRGRQRIRTANLARRVPTDQGWSVLAELSTALRGGDLARISQLLAPDVVMTTDGAGRVNAAGRPLVGALEVGRFLHGLVTLASRHAVGFDAEPALVNGDPGFIVRLDGGRPRDPKVSVYSFTISDGRIAAVYAVLAPDKADVHRRHQHHQVGQAVGQDAAPAQASRLHQRPRDEHAGVVAHREHGFGVLPVPAPPPCQCGANPPRRGLFAVIEVKGDAGH